MSATTPGWYPDPWSASSVRYWDGSAWTPHIQPAAENQWAAPQTAPEGTSWNTLWIWLVVVPPIISTVLALLYPWGSMFDVDFETVSPIPTLPELFGSPWLWLGSVLGWLVFAATVFFAYRDYTQLGERGVPRPFHWAWAFLYPVYPIGRAIVVKRRTGHGSVVLWATIAGIVLSVVVTMVMIVEMTVSMMELLVEIMRERMP